MKTIYSIFYVALIVNSVVVAVIDTVPVWHVLMIQDSIRNQAFYNVIQKYVIPNKSVVLDIGAGTGLLSLFAAKAGAVRVTAVELNEVLSNVATEVVRRNNYSDVIDVLNIHSNNLSVGSYSYSEPADILVSETLDGWIISEGFIDTLKDLRSRDVIKPNAVIIPNRGSVFIQLAQSKYSFSSEVPTIHGFDMSAVYESLQYFDSISTQTTISVAKELADPVHMMDFNFQDCGLYKSPTPYVSLMIPVKSSGILHGAALWFSVCVDAECEHRIGNSPGEPSHWDQMYVHFQYKHSYVEAGTIINLLVAQISMRYVFALPAYGQRIVEFSNDCKRDVVMYKVHDDGTNDLVTLIPSTHMIVQLAEVGEEFIFVTEIKSEVDGLEEEEIVGRIRIPNKWDEKSEIVPLYEYYIC